MKNDNVKCKNVESRQPCQKPTLPHTSLPSFAKATEGKGGAERLGLVGGMSSAK